MIGKRLRKIIQQIALNILYIKEKEICPVYISKINSNCEKQIILLMIPNEENVGWHYLAVKKLSALLHGITFRTENKLKSYEKVCKNKGICEIAMPLEKDNILEFDQYMKSDKMPYFICADMESLIKKKNGCANNPNNSSTAKIGEHIPCGYSMPTIWAFDNIEKNHTLRCFNEF